MQTGDIPKESLEALIVTIPKPSKPHDDPANYRPISLLNSDIKIYAKIHTSRISLYIPTFVHTDQVGFIPKRQATNGTRRFLDLIHWAETHASQEIWLGGFPGGFL